MEFSEQLKSYRKSLGKTQEEMADFIGFPVRTYRSWEQGKRIPIKIYREMILIKIDREMILKKIMEGGKK